MCMNLRLSCALAVLLLCPFMTLAQKNSGYDAGYHPTVEAGLVLNGNVAAVSVVTSQGYCFGNGLYIGDMTGIVFGSMSSGGGPFFSGFTPGNAGNSGVYAGVSYCF